MSPEPVDAPAFLRAASIDPSVRSLRPDYRALLITAQGLPPDVHDAVSEPLLQHAEAQAREALQSATIEAIPHVAAWREAYRQFGARPQRTRNSLEALLRRVESGLPRVNPLTDVYNAISVLHSVPIGGEDLDRYTGAPRLIRAIGTETFDTTASGEDVVEHPEEGEVAWADDAGVTCRRWNWRQARRTQLRPDTTAALFILDALEPMSDSALDAAGDDLIEHLQRWGGSVRIDRVRLPVDVEIA